jgi:hypothetical protein
MTVKKRQNENKGEPRMRRNEKIGAKKGKIIVLKETTFKHDGEQPATFGTYTLHADARNGQQSPSWKRRESSVFFGRETSCLESFCFVAETRWRTTKMLVGLEQAKAALPMHPCIQEAPITGLDASQELISP